MENPPITSSDEAISRPNARFPAHVWHISGENELVPSDPSKSVSRVGEPAPPESANQSSNSAAEYRLYRSGRATDVRDSAGQWTTYTYDVLDRLTQDATTGLNTHTYNYGYDSVDNRTSSSETGSNITYDYDLSGRLRYSYLGLVTTSYSYDANGNLTVIETPTTRVTMSYDKENRLSVHQADRKTFVTNTYDGDGKKRAEITGTGTTTLIWDGDTYLQGRS